MKRLLTLAGLMFLVTGAAQASLSRTAVSLYGSNSNPCSLNAPCATFAYAISQTNPGGELIALDSGGYDGFTVDRPMHVTVAPGAVVTVGKELGTTNWAIKVNAPKERVSLRGFMVATTGSVIGIVAHDAAATYIDDVIIEGNGCASGCATGIFGRRGDVFVNHARIRNVFQGIDHNPLETSTIEVRDSIIDNAELVGISIENYGKGIVRNTVVSHCGRAFSAGSLNGAKPELALIDCSASSSKTGVEAGSGSTVRIERTAVTRNDVGLKASGGTMITHGNSMIDGNTVDTSGPMTINAML
jgi:hypothetical protein